MKVLVTGAKGQLGRDVVKHFQNSGHDVIEESIDNMDLSIIEDVADKIAKYNADWVINCAAYTQVDKAEEEAELAFRINRDAVKEIAKGVLKSQGKLLHISTDYVFDGSSTVAYKEDDDANPLGVYGKSKLQGEEEVKKILPDAIILRTAWVYGVYGNNFIKTILRLALDKKELRVVNDQIGSPTWTVDITRAISTLIENNEQGTYHFSSDGAISWYEVACETVNIAKELGYEVITENILPVSTGDYPTLAVRPAYSVLSNVKINEVSKVESPDWKNSLHSMIKLYKSHNRTM